MEEKITWTINAQKSFVWQFMEKGVVPQFAENVWTINGNCLLNFVGLGYPNLAVQVRIRAKKKGGWCGGEEAECKNNCASHDVIKLMV